jgi:hypothetical protein
MGAKTGMLFGAAGSGAEDASSHDRIPVLDIGR